MILLVFSLIILGLHVWMWVELSSDEKPKELKQVPKEWVEPLPTRMQQERLHAIEWERKWATTMGLPMPQCVLDFDEAKKIKAELAAKKQQEYTARIITERPNPDNTVRSRNQFSTAVTVPPSQLAEIIESRLKGDPEAVARGVHEVMQTKVLDRDAWYTLTNAQQKKLLAHGYRPSPPSPPKPKVTPNMLQQKLDELTDQTNAMVLANQRHNKQLADSIHAELAAEGKKVGLDLSRKGHGDPMSTEYEYTYHHHGNEYHYHDGRWYYPYKVHNFKH